MPRLTKTELEARLEASLDDVARLRHELAQRAQSAAGQGQPAAERKQSTQADGRQLQRRPPPTKAEAWEAFWDLLARYEVADQLHQRPLPPQPRK